MNKGMRNILTACTGLALQTAALAQPPNIIVIMADDLGYNDVGFDGCKDIPTPNLDKLAASGARFASGYVTAPMCAPSRAGFVTGRFQSTFGWYGNSDQPLNPKEGLPPGIQTVAKLMQAQGYVTGQTTNAPHHALFWRIDKRPGQETGVLRIGDYKLIVQKGKAAALYDLRDDLSETTDLSKTEPERAQTMLARWKTLDQSSKPPLWKPLSKKEQMKDEYQYKDYEWLKGTPYYRASQK